MLNSLHGNTSTFYHITNQTLLRRFLPADLHANSKKGCVATPRWHKPYYGPHLF